MAGITVKNVAINGNNISFVLPKGDVLVKTVGTFSMPQSAKFTFPITPEAESSNGFWFPITRDLNIKDGFRPTVTNGGNQISKARIYAKVGKPIGTNSQGHQLYSISKLGFCALNVNNYIEDFECADGTLQSAMSKLVGENLGNGTGIVKLREANNANTSTTQSEQPGNGAKTGADTTVKTPRMEISDRVGALQAALNAAGYTDDNGKQLVVDKKGGPITQAVAKKAGVDYAKWKVGDPIKPASQTQTSPTGTTQAQTTAAPSGTTQTQTTQQTVDYSQSPAYARYLGGANQQEIRKFQYNVGLEPTGVFDQQTAYKAYELATSEDANNQNAVDFKEAGSTIKGYSTYDFRKAAADKATADVTAKYEKQNSEREMQGYTDASNQSLASLNAALDTYLKRSGLAKDKIAYIKNNIARGDFEDAKLFAGQLRMKGAKEIQQLITQYEAAYNKQKAYAAQMQGAQQGAGQQQGQTNQSAAQTANTNGQMNESALVNMLTDMVLNEGKKKPNKSVMNESKLVDMIAESMIKNGVITL